MNGHCGSVVASAWTHAGCRIIRMALGSGDQCANFKGAGRQPPRFAPIAQGLTFVLMLFVPDFLDVRM